MTPELSRRRLLAGALTAASAGLFSGCGYRPGGGDIMWEDGAGTGPFRPDDLLASESVAFTVNRSVRGFDFEAEEWGESAEIAAYDAASGGPIWEETTPPSGRPAAAGGRLFVGHEEDGIVAFESDGETRWETDVDSFPRTLAAGDGRVYALTETGDLRAFAADDGERLWRAEVGSDDGGAGDGATLAATPNGVAVHYRRNAVEAAVVAVRRDGERRWTAELRAVPHGRPVVDGEAGTVFVPAEGTLLALSLEDGTERWSENVMGLGSSLAVGNGRVYHVGRRALSARTASGGDRLWGFEPPGRRGVSSPPAVADGQVYVGGDDAVYAISSSDGSVRWQVECERVTDAPRVVGRTVVVMTGDGYVRGHHRG